MVTLLSLRNIEIEREIERVQAVQDVDRLAVDESGDRKQSWANSQDLRRDVVTPRRREVQNADRVISNQSMLVNLVAQFARQVEETCQQGW